MPKIITAMQSMGYKFTQGGVCFGLAAMSAQAVIRKDAQSFTQRIALIHNSDGTFPATIQKDKKIELQGFFDELSIYQGPNTHPELSAIFPDLRQNVANLELLTPESELASYDLLTEKEKEPIALPKIKATLINNFTPSEFIVFVQKIAELLNGEPFSFLISESTTNHAIQLGFDGFRWLLTNHDEIEICENTESNIQGLVLTLFDIISSVHREQKTLSIDIILSNFSQTNLAEFEQCDFDVNLLTPEFDRNILFELVINARRLNKVTLLKALIDKIKRIDPTLNLFIQALEFKDGCGQSILFRAAANTQYEMLNLLIDEIENADLSEVTKANLLIARDDIGRSSLYCVALKGDINTANTLLYAINKIQWHSLRQDMISSQSFDKSSAIHMAVVGGCTKMVELLLDAIDKLKISERQKFKLITAKTNEGVSALHMAADRGHNDIIELLLSAVKQKNVLEESKLAWITLTEHSLLNIAARGGYITMAGQLFKAIEDLNLDAATKEKHKKYLINAKGEKGISTSMIAAKYGHVEFYHYILDAYKQLYKDTNLLTQRQAEGISAMYFAAEYGRKEMVNYLINAIMALGVDDLYKAKLIEAKRYNNACALSLAAQHGHSEVVNKVLEAIFTLNLPKDVKFHLIDARNENDASALLLAVNKGDITTVKTLVDFILSSDLTAQAKTTLLTSAPLNFNIKSAYQYALYRKYQHIADYLKSVILSNQVFTDKQKSTILDISTAH